MTTTNACTLGSKNSSRVLRPPGGGTSFNIFGVGPEEPKQTRATQRHQQSIAAAAAASPAAEHVAAPPTAEAAVATTETTDSSNAAAGAADSVQSEGEGAATIIDKTSEEAEPDETKKDENVPDEEASDVKADAPPVKGAESGATTENDNKDASPKVEVTAQEDSRTTEVIEDKNKVSPNTKAKAKAAEFNPITGEAYNKTAAGSSVSTVTNIRVRQPPGGASTKLW